MNQQNVIYVFAERPPAIDPTVHEFTSKAAARRYADEQAALLDLTVIEDADGDFYVGE